MTTFYIEFEVHEDYFRYCAYIEANTKEEAINRLKKEEEDVKKIAICKVAY